MTYTLASAVVEKPVLTADQADELWQAEKDAEVPDWGFICIEEGDEGRWRRHHTMILQHVGGHFWGLDFEVGLTENCDDSLPWRADYSGKPLPTDPMDIFRVWPKQVTVTTWVTKEPSDVTV